MNPDILKILSDSNKDIDNQKLMDYVAGKLSASESHELEALMAENDFLNDALEGLQQVKDKKNLEGMVDVLNNDLHKKLNQKKNRKDKRKIKELTWIYYAIVLILLFIILTWVVIYYLQSR
jgi:anti-sigma factor RsiW